jgi:3'-5' exoribonuclease
MLAELTGLIDDMADPHLRGLLQDFFADPDFTAAFVRAPAAKRFHHAYMAGLLEHTLSVARAAGAVSALYPDLDRDLLLAGAVLHDVGKIKEYGLDLAGDFTDAGRLVGHLVMGVEMVAERVAARPDFPEQTALLLKHLLLSHHGEYELGSPKRPKILEALALNLIDDLDAKMNGLGGFIERHADPETGWTDFNRLMDRYFYRPPRAGTEAEVEVEAEPAGRMEEPEAAVEAGGGGDGSQPQPPAPEAESTEVDRRDRDQLSFLNE